VSVDAPNERQLVRRAAGGDHGACREIVARHHAPVYRLLAHLTRDAQRAEELTCEVFATAWGGLAAFDGRSALGTWLQRIAYTKFIDSLRRSARERRGVDALAHHGSRREAAADPFSGIEMDDRVRRVRDALERLDDRARALVILHYTQRLSYSTISEITGEPEGTIKWRIGEVLKSLRKDLSETNHEPAQRQPGPAAGTRA
jgi:RNA polymerase sigma-70 factor (ECF subfamily)